MTGESPIRFTSWNVKGLNGPIKRSKIFSHLKRLKSDIIFLQETNLLNSDHLRLQKLWVGHIYHSKCNAKARGTAILIHKKNQFSDSVFLLLILGVGILWCQGDYFRLGSC